MTISPKQPIRQTAPHAVAAPGAFGKVLAAVLIAFSLCSAPGRAEAGVNFRNGNFYITYTDIALGGGMALEFSRTYNSRSGFRGILGTGWSTESQTALRPLPDGSIMVIENGGGAENLFTEERQDPVKTEAIIALLKPFKRWVEKNVAEKEYLDDIRSDAESRRSEVTFLYDRKLLKASELPVGTILKSLRYGKQYIVRIPAGYCRYYENGKKEYFDPGGLLTRSEDANGNWHAIAYGNQGMITRISDNQGSSIDFSYNGQGLLERVKGSGPSSGQDRETSYQYNSLQQLIRSTDIGGNQYLYEYDKRTNLTAIRYIDGTSMEIRYYPQTKFEMVSSVKLRDGRLFSYQYPADQRHEGARATRETTVVTESLDGKTVKQTTYDYFYDFTATGEQIRRREVVTTDGDTVSYDNDDQGYCLKMTTSAGETSYRYDDQHSITRLETPQGIDSFEYHPANHKLTSLTETDRAGAVKKKTAYTFSNEWHLLAVTDDKGNSLSMEYDGGDISKIRYNSTLIGFIRKDDSILIEAAYEGGKLSADYDTRTREVVPAPGTRDEDLRHLNACVASVLAYYRELLEKANVRISGHAEHCTCTTSQYEIPARLAILDKFPRAKAFAAKEQ